MRMPRLFAAGLVLALLLAPIAAMAQSVTIARSIAASQVTISTTATITAIARANRQAVTIQNHGATAAYCGPDSTVTTTTGFRLPGVDGASITIPASPVIYCIVAAGTQAVSVIESF